LARDFFVSEHHKFVTQDPFMGSFWQSFHHPEAERLLAAGHPKDPVLGEHIQVYEIDRKRDQS
jgi:hypothetical protein